MASKSIRVSWRAAGLPETQAHMVDVYGTGSNYTCTAAPSANYCDLLDVVCGDVYTVVVAPVDQFGDKVSFCPHRVYAGKTGPGQHCVVLECVWSVA